MLKLIVLLTFTTMSIALQCRDGFFVRSDAFDVDRSSPAPLTCPPTAEAGCVRFEVEGSFRTGSQNVQFTFWKNACGSQENCTSDCTEELDQEMLRIIRQVGRDQNITTNSTCVTACCADDDCNKDTVQEIKDSGRLASEVAGDTDGSSLIEQVGDVVDTIVDVFTGSPATRTKVTLAHHLAMGIFVVVCLI